MRTVVVVGEPPDEIKDWLKRRHARGQDGFDEVWEGVYHVSPMAHPRHGMIDREVAVRLHERARNAGLVPCGPLNIGDPDDYRVPDGAYLREVPSVTYVPSAAIVVEIVSRGDETYDKFDFYFARGVEELLVVDNPPGEVGWYVRGESAFVRADRSVVLGVTDHDLAAEIDWPKT